MKKTKKYFEVYSKLNKNYSMTKHKNLLLLFISMVLSSMTYAQDCVNCFDDGPNGCGIQGYIDMDGDGYGTTLNCFENSNADNYASVDGDCDDNDDTIYPKRWYKDIDGDGFGVLNAVGKVFCSTIEPPAGWAANNLDCDDTQANITTIKYWYADVDSDGYGNPTTEVIDCGAPAGMTNPVNIGGDFDDTIPEITNIAPQNFYFDNDGDSFGTNSIVEYRSEPSSSSFVPDGNDCDDNDILVHPNTVWYVDADGDGVGVSNQGNLTQCARPADNPNPYVLIAGDQCPFEFGAEANNGCPPDDYTTEPWNTVLTIGYNAAGEGISKNKVYYDDLGKQIQSQSLDILTNRVWASEAKYDDFGRPVIQTLSAPINSQGFMLHEDSFMRKSNSSEYTVNDFVGNESNPPVVGNQLNSLGWYYSENNTSEPYQDVTDYPFSGKVYSALNPGTTLQTVGGNKINGEWYQGYSFSMRASKELQSNKAFAHTDFNNNKIIKTVVRSVEGIENVLFTDADGKTLAGAKSGGDTANAISIVIEEQGYVDIHVPEGASMGFTVNENGNATTTYNLITEIEVTPSTGLPNGFYRVLVDDVDAYDIASLVTVNYKENYYDYSLNEYDKVGRLIASYQPLKGQNGDRLVTTYKYNTLGQLIYTKSPDEGEAWFVYRKDGQIRFSQNSQQLESGDNPFSVVANGWVSYTDYDELGRPDESGIIGSSLYYLSPDHEITGGYSRKEVTKTQYDFVDASELTAIAGLSNAYHSPSFLAGNVAKTENDESTTYYSYDAYGRVKWLVQQINGLSESKTIDYKYDPITGVVRQVIYQKDKSDQFIHKYEYNQQDQLILVKTSTNGVDYSTHAEYEYYETGALKKTILAEGTQVVDYVYNLAGQLKSINNPSLSPTNLGDAEDLFGMQLDYHNNDYSRSSVSNITTPAYGTDQLNGNIKGVRWNNKKENAPVAYTYEYDRNQWLTDAYFGTYQENGSTVNPQVIDDTAYNSGVGEVNVEATTSITLSAPFHFTATTNDTYSAKIVPGNGFQELGNGDFNVTGIKYDVNGNIRELNRKKNTEAGSNAMDDLTYHYDPVKPNQLMRVEDTDDNVANADDLGTQIGNEEGRNYIYNEIGQLIEDYEYVTPQKPDDIVRYTYNASGLVTEVSKNYIPLVKFFYNERGHRIRKQSFDLQGNIVSNSYYVRDAEGSVLSIQTNTTFDNSIALENPIHGLGRIGVFKQGSAVTNYELSDYLGNVRAVFTKNDDIAQEEGYSDYYPFGMQMPDRILESAYRYNYQGQEKDPETGKVAFELRLWDARIGRWLSPDPAGQYASPYLGMENNPANVVDPDGGCTDCSECPDFCQSMDRTSIDENYYINITSVGGLEHIPLPSHQLSNSLSYDPSANPVYLNEVIVSNGSITHDIYKAVEQENLSALRDFQAWARYKIATDLVNIKGKMVAEHPATQLFWIVVTGGMSSSIGGIYSAGFKTPATATEGIYQFTAASGKTYVGQSVNIPTRLAQHIASGKLIKGTPVKTYEVLGGKTAREIAEQMRIKALGGIHQKGIKVLENYRNPIGKAREYLLPN